MGTTFANIQVQNVTLSAIEKVLTAEHENKSVASTYQNFLNLHGGSDISHTQAHLVKKLIKLNNEENSKYMVGQVTEKWVTILNNNFDWESVKEIALKYSKRLTGVILSVGYFDDEIFEMSLFENGKRITGHVSGNVDFYGMKEEMGNIKLIKSTLGLDASVFEIASILKMNDLADKVREFERITRISLWLNADWFENFANELKGKFKIIQT